MNNMKIAKVSKTSIKTFNDEDIENIIARSIPLPLFFNTELNVEILEPTEANGALVIEDIGESDKVMNVPIDITVVYYNANGVDTTCVYVLQEAVKSIGETPIDHTLN